MIRYRAFAVFPLLAFFFWILYQSNFLKEFDYYLYDRLATHLPPSGSPDSTVIVDIDEESLHQFGQWPWPRIITAKLIETIGEAKPKTIALDMVFSEPDRTSPIEIERFYNRLLGFNIGISGMDNGLMDNDRLLAQTLSEYPVVLSLFSNPSAPTRPCLLPNNVSISQGIAEDILPMENLVCSMPLFQRNAKGIGHIHAQPDSDGVLRSLSLIRRYEDVYIPVLGLAAIAGGKKIGIVHHGDDYRIESPLGKISVDPDSKLMIRPYPLADYRTVSAVSLLDGSADPRMLKGKYVFVGTSAMGLDTWHALSEGSRRSGVMIHATVTENLLNGDLMYVPEDSATWGMVCAASGALILLWLMFTRRFISVLWAYSVMMVIGAVVVSVGWYYGVYLSIGYFLVPLSGFFFLLSAVMFVIDYWDKKVFMETIRRTESEKAQLADEVDYQKAMVLHQSKRAAMGETVDHIAHQWRQPLGVLGVLIQNCILAFHKGRLTGEYINTMGEESMKQIDYMSQTIDDFRSFLKPDRIDAVFDVNLAICESVRLLEGTLSSGGITVRVHETDEPLRVFGSIGELKQVIVNLIQNAKDALVQTKPHEPCVTVSVQNDGIEAKIVVTDNGGGIPDGMIERIFDPYFTTKPEGKGSGIGLYLSRALIESKMKGRLMADSENGFTRFTIFVPLALSGIDV